MPNLSIITILKICTLLLLPMMFLVIWLLPRLFNSKRHSKMLVVAVIVSTFILLTMITMNQTPRQLQNIKFITAVVVIFWSLIGFFIGTYYDIRLRVELGPKYYNEVMDFRAHAMKYAFVGFMLSLALGVFIGWIVITFGLSLIGCILGILFGAFYGGVLGRLLDVVS